jgi:hypothetical protein
MELNFTLHVNEMVCLLDNSFHNGFLVDSQRGKLLILPHIHSCAKKVMKLQKFSTMIY